MCAFLYFLEKYATIYVSYWLLFSMSSIDSHSSRDAFSHAMSDKHLDAWEAKQLLGLFQKSGIRYTIEALQDLKRQLWSSMVIGENKSWVSSWELIRVMKKIAAEDHGSHPLMNPSSSSSLPTENPMKESQTMPPTPQARTSWKIDTNEKITTFDQLIHMNDVAFIGDSLTVWLVGWGSNEIHTSSVSAKVWASSWAILNNLRTHIDRYPNVKTVFVLAGTNDVISGSSKQAISHLAQMKNLCESKGIRMIAATIPPMGDYIARNKNAWAINQSISEVNVFVRENFTQFIDYHILLQNIDRPTYLSKEAHSSDGLHIGNTKIMQLASLQTFNKFG